MGGQVLVVMALGQLHVTSAVTCLLEDQFLGKLRHGSDRRKQHTDRGTVECFVGLKHRYN